MVRTSQTGGYGQSTLFMETTDTTHNGFICDWEFGSALDGFKHPVPFFLMVRCKEPVPPTFKVSTHNSPEIALSRPKSKSWKLNALEHTPMGHMRWNYVENTHFGFNIILHTSMLCNTAYQDAMPSSSRDLGVKKL